MSEDDIRRVGPGDRKDRLERPDELFPEDPRPPDGNIGLSDPLPDTDLPGIIDDDLAHQLETELNDPIKPLHYIPEEERFPSLANLTLEDEKPAPKPETEPKPERYRGDWRHNLVAVLFLFGTFALVAYFAYVWQNPYSEWNPLAKPTPYVYVTWTPLPPTAIMENTPEPLVTDASVLEVTTAPINIPFSGMPFVVADSGIIYAPNSNGRGCNWASIAGTVSGPGLEPLNNYAIQIVDADDPTRLNVQVFSGSALTFGDGGFEFNISGAPRAGNYSVQLFDEFGEEMSEVYNVETKSTCAENVAIINFIQVGG